MAHYKKLHIILGHFDQIMNAFFTVVKNPYDPKVLAPGFANIIINVLSIVDKTFKRNKTLNTCDKEAIAAYIQTIEKELNATLCHILRTQNTT